MEFATILPNEFIVFAIVILFWGSIFFHAVSYEKRIKRQ